MNEQYVDKNNYDVASISRKGREKRANYIQDALKMDAKKVNAGGQFVKIFSDMFLAKQASDKSYF